MVGPRIARRSGRGAPRRVSQTVAVQASPTLDTVVAIVAGLRSGVVVVPVAGDAGPMEREHILRDSGATAVLGAPDWPDVTLPRIDLADGSGDGIGDRAGATPRRHS